MIFSESVGKLYTNHAIIGNGAFGKVFSAQRATDKKMVAVKEIDTAGAGSADRGIIISEFMLYPDIIDPNIVTCYTTHFDEVSGHLYLEMEFCSGGSLADLIKRQRMKKQPFPEREIWRIFKELASALFYLHSPSKKSDIGSIIHRDIKPSNIVFSNSGNAKICDFGLSRSLSELSVAHSRVGTDTYMAPEVESGAYNEKIDIWSLGCVILELCTLHKPKPRDPIILETYSPQLASILRSCLAVDPKERFSSAKLLHMLSSCEAQALSRKTSAYYGLSDDDNEEEDAGDRELRERKEKLRAQETKQQETAAEPESLVFFDQELDLSTLNTLTVPAQDDTQQLVTPASYAISDFVEGSVSKPSESVNTSEQNEDVQALLQQYNQTIEMKNNEIARLRAILATQAQPATLAALRSSIETQGRMTDDVHGSVDFAVKDTTRFTTHTTLKNDSVCISPRSGNNSITLVFEDLVSNQYKIKINQEIEMLQRSIKSKDAVIEELKKQTEIGAKGTKTYLDALNKDIKDLEAELKEKDAIIEELCEAIDKKNTLLESIKKRNISVSVLSEGSTTDRTNPNTPENIQLRLSPATNSALLEKDQQIQQLREELARERANNAVYRETKYKEQDCVIQDLTASLHSATAEIATLRQRLEMQFSLSASNSYAPTPGSIQMTSLELSQHLSRINELEHMNEVLVEELTACESQIEDLREAVAHQEVSFIKLHEALVAQQAEKKKLQEVVWNQEKTISSLVHQRSPHVSPIVPPK